MQWVLIGGAVIAVLAFIGWISEKAEERRAELEADKDDIPRFEDGMPYPGDAIRRAHELFEAGKDDEALDLLHRCRNECAEREMMSSVQTLSNEIIGLRDRRAADALGLVVLEELTRHPEGIMQTALYRELPDHDQELLRYACYRLAETGKIERIKKGRSYMLHPLD